MKKNLISVFLVVVLAFFIAGCGSTGSGGGSRVTTFGSHGTGNGQFDYPGGIAIDSNGNVYVSDSDNHRIQKFTANGTFIKQWGLPSSVNRSFPFHPRGSVVANNKLYVCDASNSKVHIFDLEGNYQSSWTVPDYFPDIGGTVTPIDIDVDSNGYFYVVDNINYRVVKFNSAGADVDHFGTDITGDTGLWGPTAIAIIGNEVFITDSGNNRINVFTTSGDWVRHWGSEGTGNGQFFSPPSISAMGNNHVIVGDTQQTVYGRIQKFTKTGSYVSTFKPLNGDFYPLAIAVNNSTGKIYIADAGHDRIIITDVF